MARYYVFATQAQAQACAERIWGRMKSACVAQGYTIDPATGGIVGKDAAGRDVPGALTLAWDRPRQRGDGKWIVICSAAVPGQTFVIDASRTPPLTLAAALAADDLSAGVTVEVEDASWWPAPPSLGARL
ncbi:hypothetical protein MKK75_32315 [Methylobacterium sp. J-030]|uniref:hypothetical protein n=1 Tax=Methylobacterium sp. J-030 TaxID=2836627 RepID=UPI001FB90BE6|nr:hypothetical protein [Methylobacterium sp. J-030]MCJ2073416.1 hypothetical protein [Methylobacterium sp. J-030]